MRKILIPSEGKVSVTSREAFKHYKANAKFRNKDNTYRHTDYAKIVRSFWTKVGRDLVENEAGVFIKNFGYFTVLRHPRKSTIKYADGKTYFNPKTDNYIFTPSFFGVAKKKPLLNFWTMDRAFSRSEVKAPLHKKLKGGMKYKTLISTLSSLYLLKNTIDK